MDKNPGKSAAELLSESAKEMKNITSIVEKTFEEKLDRLNIFLDCQDGSGEVYNRKTGERFKLQKVSRTQKNVGQKDPLNIEKSIGKFFGGAHNDVKKGKIGVFK